MNVIACVKQRGTTAWKVFKLKLLLLEPGQHVVISHDQVILDFTTRTHYGSRHPVLPMRYACIVGLHLADRAISTAVVMQCVPRVTVMVRTLR
ncbi:hypothetical protein [Burkholderia sp. Bp8963]|uniref:hypothetical protein n=1 Tax=Burkholderia sp. Bp8963 TaxID=2184547 RepID=UPI000F5972EF|nr:hypothetical protein [Burkholderia sp. Bp8963]